MTPKDVVLSQYSSAQWLFQTAVKDLSDEECRFQPFAGANHVNWVLTHLAISEDSLIAQLTGKPKHYSEALHKAYGGGSQCRADDGMTRAEAWKMFEESSRRTIEFLKTFPENRYDDEAPEKLRQMFPTVGSVVGLIGAHPFWHLGHVTFNRRALNKPLMFG